MKYDRFSPNPSLQRGKSGQRDVFISHAGEDSAVVLEIVRGLEQAGYTTWYYQRDCLPGLTHLDQTSQAIEEASVVLLLISKNSLPSGEVDSEVDWTHLKQKPFLPVLIGITWSEFEQRQRKWRFILGSSVGITVPPEGVSAILSRMVAAMHRMNIVPKEDTVMLGDLGRYPFPLAAAYTRHMASLPQREGIFQYHEGLRDLTETIVRYLTLLAVAQYRKSTLAPGNEDSAAESALINVRQAGLSHWVALLDSVLSLSNETPVQTMYDVFCQKSHTDDSIEAAAARIRDWLGLPSRRGHAAVTYRDFLDLLVLYREGETGWAASGAVLSQEAYRERVEVLRRALEQILLDLEFLTDYPLGYVESVSKEMNDRWLHRIHEGMGRDVSVRTEPLGLANALPPEHLYLFKASGSSLAPLLDLHPLLLCRECPSCGQPGIFLLYQAGADCVDYVNPACGHHLQVTAETNPALHSAFDDFFSLERWRRAALPPASSDFLPYVNALREVLAAGEITADSQQKLDFLSRALRIPVDIGERLKETVQREMQEAKRLEEERQAELRRQEEKRAEQLRREQEEAHRQTELAEQARQEQALPHQKLVLRWQQPTGGAVSVIASFAPSLTALVVNDVGEVHVYDADGQIVYRDQVAGRPYKSVGFGDRVLVGTWEGDLYCFGTQELLWQRNFGSPISSLEADEGLDLALAGTWDGQITAWRASSEAIWSSRLEDGISALALSDTVVAAGSYGGHLCLLDATGAKLWVRELPAGVVDVALVRGAGGVLVATRDRLLRRVSIQTQEIVWEHSVGHSIMGFALSKNDRRLAMALGDGQLLLYSVDAGLNLRNQYSIADLVQVLFSPLSADGRFVFAHSRSQGLLLLDNRSAELSAEVDGTVDSIAVSTDGRHVLVSGDDTIARYDLTRPELRAALVPLGELRRGRFTRLRITLTNVGQRTSRRTRVELSGPLECPSAASPVDLEPGKEVIFETQSLQPTAEGELPVRVRITCVDDLDLPHESESIEVLTVPAVN